MPVFIPRVLFKGRSLAGIRAAAAKAVPRPFGGNCVEIPWVLDFVYYIME